MPTRRVPGRPNCYRWGQSGKIYCGPGAKAKADRQGRAIHASGYRAESKSLGLSRKDITLLGIGALTGIVAGVLGEFVSEILVDRLRKEPQLEITDEEQPENS